MAVVLALGAALVYGSADFLGGLASRRRAALAVAFAAQACGALVLVAFLPFLGPAVVTPRDVLLGAVGGVFGGLGLVLLYRGLAAGPMSVVAPVTAVAASVVPILVGLALGERPGGPALLGIVVALVAVLLITRESATPVAAEKIDAGTIEAGPAGDDGPLVGRRSVVAGALAAGASFGLFFVALHGTSADAGLYPLLGARLVSVPLLGFIAWRGGASLGSALRGPGTGGVVACGVLDMGANVLYLLALRQGMLAVVSAVAGLYPAATVLWAQGVLSERVARPQVFGLVLAVGATTLIAV